MKRSINISVINDASGIPQSNDGIMGIVAKATAVANKFALGQPYLITKLSDLTALGIDAAYDATNSVAVFQQISEYYGQAGDGALLWLYGLAKATTYATLIASTAFDDFVRFTAQADPVNRVKMIGFCYDVPTATQSTADFPADVTASITALQTKQNILFNQGYQFSAIIDGYNMSTAVTPSTIMTMATQGAYSVSLCITGTKGNGVSAVGLALGRFARITVGRGFGAVADGAVNTTAAFLTNSVVVQPTGTLIVGNTYTVYGGPVTYNNATYQPSTSLKLVKFTAVSGQTTFTTTGGGFVVDNATPIQLLPPSDIDQLGQKQFMFLRKWFNHAGFYWNDGATCENPDKQLSTQEYNRVANKLSANALSFFIDEMGKNLPVDVTTGNVDQGYLSAKQAEFTTEFITPMTAAGTGDISGATITVTGVNFNATKELDFVIDIVPTPILGTVNGTIQFTATL